MALSGKGSTSSIIHRAPLHLHVSRCVYIFASLCASLCGAPVCALECDRSIAIPTSPSRPMQGDGIAAIVLGGLRIACSIVDAAADAALRSFSLPASNTRYLTHATSRCCPPWSHPTWGHRSQYFCAASCSVAQAHEPMASTCILSGAALPQPQTSKAPVSSAAAVGSARNPCPRVPDSYFNKHNIPFAICAHRVSRGVAGTIDQWQIPSMRLPISDSSLLTACMWFISTSCVPRDSE